MKFFETKIKDLLVVEPRLIKDKRGWFCETYNSKDFEKKGINVKFKQDNHSFSLVKGVLRGLHYQKEPFPQTKLVRCTKGRIWDVAVDLRETSLTYLQWFGLELSEKNHKMLFIPQGFAHGFVTLEENCEVQYKVDNIYDSELDSAIKYDDEDINVNWPLKEVILSDKDKNAPALKDIGSLFK